jgi:hypothetical protein
MPIFKLSLAKTCYEHGFFNVTVDFDRYVGSTGPLRLIELDWDWMIPPPALR